MPTIDDPATDRTSYDDLEPLDPVLVHMFSGYVLRTAFDLRLPDAVGDEPVPIGELAVRVGVNPDALRRLLRVLSAIGLFVLVGDDRCAHNRASRLLSSSTTFGRSLGALCADWVWRTWECLTDAVRTGESPFRKVHGKGFFDYLREDDPEACEAFNSMMTDGLGPTNDAIAKALDLTAATTLVDVGGGQGSLLGELLRRNEHLHGVLFDLPTALTHVVPSLRTGELAHRCEVVAGDAFRSVPTGADVYLLRAILHDWDDENCVRLLSQCAQAARPGSRIIVVEQPLDDNQQPSASIATLDLHMLLLLGGKERTESEFADLFRRAGLTYVGSTPTLSQLRLLEAQRR